jgi:ribosomal protein S18 acetylase RimI-like enzyme
VPGIVTLMNRAYRGAGAAGWSTQESYLFGDRIPEDGLRADLLANPQASLLKWEDPEGGPLLGCVWIEPLDDDVWYLGSLAADPTRQNSRLGKILLTGAERWVGERGGKGIRMQVVNVRDALIAWYLRRGYRKTGETEAFPMATIVSARRSAAISAFWSLRKTSKTAVFPWEGAESASGMPIALVCPWRHTLCDCAAEAAC